MSGILEMSPMPHKVSRPLETASFGNENIELPEEESDLSDASFNDHQKTSSLIVSRHHDAP